MEPVLPEGTLDGLRRRDPDAIAACYEAFAEPLYRYLRSACSDRSLAEDLVEATFVELVEAAPALVGGPPAVRAWLFRAGRHNLLDEVRKQRRRGDVPLDAEAAERRPAPDAGPEQRAVEAELAGLLREAVAALSPDQREVIALRFFADLSGPEVAAVTGRRVGAVKALQHRAVRALERILRDRGQLDAARAAVALARNSDRTSRAVRNEEDDR